MGTILASALIDLAEIVLQDTGNVRWPAEELLGWLNEGQREIVLFKPDANPINASVALAAGTKQAIPAAGTCLLKVVRNMGTNGTTAGNVIRLIDQQILDDQNPDWHTETGAAVINYYTYDERDPKNFYVYPPSDGTTQAEIIYAAAPANILSNAAITLGDIYASALVDYILFRAYSKNVEYASDGQRAMAFYQSFLTKIGRKEQADMLKSPNVAAARTAG